MRKLDEEKDLFCFFPSVIPLFWENEQLLPERSLNVSLVKEAEITILHTNDLHSSVDGRHGTDGKRHGGLARIATTIRRARAAGPTLVLDVGDFVFGGGTWWDIQGAGAVARLRGKAGCDLATIGNHDLEHGMAGLWELLEGGYPLVSANLHVEDHHLQQRIRPAFIVEIAGWHVGITGLTTLSTFDLIPSRILHGITLTEPRQALIDVVGALEPMVDTIVVLSHLGFYPSGTGDPDLAMHMAGSKVSVILGGHTHAALDPAHVIAGITICNAGAYGANVGEVKLSRGSQGTVEVQTQLLPQVETIPDDPLWVEARSQMAQTFQPMHEIIFPLPVLPRPGDSALNRDREWALLAKALRESSMVPSSALLMVPLLYVVGQLPGGERVTLAEIMTAYPSIEYLVEAEINGKALRELIDLQAALLYYQQARPLRLSDETEMHLGQLDEKSMYSIITTELVCEGGLGWGLARSAIISSRNLNITCLQVVRDYLASR